MSVQIRTILSCPNQQQQKQKKTPFDCYNLRVMQGFVIIIMGPVYKKYKYSKLKLNAK